MSDCFAKLSSSSSLDLEQIVSVSGRVVEKGRNDQATSSSSAAVLGMVQSFEFKQLLNDLVKDAVSSAMQVFCFSSVISCCSCNCLFQGCRAFA